MADVTINQLTSQAPGTNDFFPFSTAVSPSTYKASLAQIKTALAIPTAVSQLTNDSAYITAASLPTSKQLAKAWVCFNGIDGSIRRSHNITGVTRNTTGVYTLTFATGTMPDSNYSVCGACNVVNVVNQAGSYVFFYVVNQGSSTCQVAGRGGDGNSYDCHSVSCQFFY